MADSQLDCDPPAAKKIRSDDHRVCNSTSKQENPGSGGGRFGKRRKYAVLLSYSGKGYMGMQKNPGVPTIEEDLLEAMCKARAFPSDMKNDLSRLKFQRCARTDKGVSAARQLVSLKMVELEDPVTLVNGHLPPQIRVMAVKKVTKSFDSRYACGGRMYEYVIPTYAFAPYRLTTADYRIPDATVELVDGLLQRYVGTHNFHNFTAGKKYKDMSSNRYIISFRTGERCVASDGDKQMEFIPLRVRGQSFLLHQIRKMIGLVIGIVRGCLKEEEFPVAFQERKFDIPKAPALGLLLDDVYFDGYNAKFCNSGERERLEWTELHPQIEDFKKQHIYRSIIETEIRELPMMKWLHTLQLHNFYETAARLGVAPAGTSSSSSMDTSLGVPSQTPSSDVQSTEIAGASSVGALNTVSAASSNVQSTETSDASKELSAATCGASSTGTPEASDMLSTATSVVQSTATSNTLSTETSDSTDLL